MSAAHRIDEFIVVKDILTKYTGLAYIKPVSKEHYKYINNLLRSNYYKFYNSLVKYEIPHKLNIQDPLMSRYKMIKDLDDTMGFVHQYFNSGLWSREKDISSNVSSVEDTSQDFTYIMFKGYNILYLENSPIETNRDINVKNKIIKHTRVFFRIKKRVFGNNWNPKSDMIMNNIDFFLEN